MPRYARKKAPRRRKANLRKRHLAIGGPTKEVVKLRYVGATSLDISLTPGNSHLFQANSMYDPDHTGVGHQPRQFDQRMTMFDHYTVLGSKITVQAVNNQTTPQGVIVACTLQDDNVALVSLDDLMEYPKKRHRITTAQQPRCTFTQNYSCKKFFHTKPLTDVNQRGSIVSNPLEGAYFGIYAHTMDNVTGTGSVDFIVTMDFIVAFTERKQPIKS